MQNLLDSKRTISHVQRAARRQPVDGDGDGDDDNDDGDDDDDVFTWQRNCKLVPIAESNQ